MAFICVETISSLTYYKYVIAQNTKEQDK